MDVNKNAWIASFVRARQRDASRLSAAAARDGQLEARHVELRALALPRSVERQRFGPK